MLTGRSAPPRVLVHIVEYHPLFSGHGIYLRRLFPHLLRHGVSVEVLAGDFGRLVSAETIEGVPVRRLPYSPQAPRREIAHAVRVAGYLVANRRRFDVVHLNGFVDTLGLVGQTAHLLGMGVVTQLVLLGADDPQTVLANYRLPSLRRWAFLRSDRLLCISSQLRDSCRQAGIPDSRLVVIPQGVDTQRFEPVSPVVRQELRRALELNDQDPVLVFVGAIIPRKGVDLLIDAWTGVQRELPCATLLLVGPDKFGPDDQHAAELNAFVARLKDTVVQRGLRARFVGRQDAVETLLQAGDAFVLPSRHEGFGNVIIEAFACGIPAVVTYMDGVGEATVSDGVNGLVVKGDADLEGALLLLLRDQRRAREMGVAARQSAESNFAMPSIAGRYVEVYEAARRARNRPR